MGGKESKPSFVTYEEAVKRVSEGELKRLKDAFKRSSTINGYMTRNIFIREVLGDGVPQRLAEQMFLAFGGTSKGLGFKDLVCGLVLLTRGRQEEKLKFLFGVYANESLSHVQREEMDALVLATEGQAHQSLSQLFLETDRVTYEMFRHWMLTHPDATSITKWLLKEPCSVTLSNELETPTFYQTLAGVTHLEETDIIELEKRYWLLKGQSKTGRFDLETFSQVVSPPIPESLCESLFTAFDENRDNHIDFKEMACGISACCRGPKTERQKFCFKIFDTDHDGLLSKAELEQMVDAMLAARKEIKSSEEMAVDGLVGVTATCLAAEVLSNHDTDKDGFITQEEYLVWTVDHSLPTDFIDLLFQISHIVLGLKPQTKDDEGQVIVGWLEREERNGFHANQTWYLVAMSWWNQWLEYVNYGPISNGHVEDGTNNNRQDGLKKTHNRSGSLSLCPNISKKASLTSITPEEGTTSVITTGFSSLPHNHVPSHLLNHNHLSGNSVTGSPTKYATIPRSNLPQNARSNRTVTDVQNAHGGRSLSGSPVHSLPSTPSMSPKVGRRGGTAQKPGAIDNNSLIIPNTTKVMTLTNEGGRLKRDKMLARGRDFELLPEPVWKALSSWYGGNPALPRTAIIPSHGGAAELELYPICVRLLRHQTQQQRPNQATSFTGMMGGIGGMVVRHKVMVQSHRLSSLQPRLNNELDYLSTDSTGLAPQPTTPRRYMAYMAAFSRKHTLKQVYDFLTSRLRIGREDMRLWKFKDEQNMHLLEEEENNMEDLGIEENIQILIEVRNKDLTWPEEMSQLAKNKAAIDKNQQVPTEKGATGLNNLGNTCFMNSALQCVSNTRILTLYFTGGMHLYELNRTNALGMKGHVAQRYGDLARDLWSGTTKSLAPLKLRWTIGKYAPRFNGFQQHDSQELLAFLLDGLHEDLNRVHNKPYVELKDSDGRRDEIVAKEAWDNHLLRNRSIVVDLFHGQLKSCVRCIECGHTSVRFDPFTFLSLPLPMESCIHLEIIVIWLDGRKPMKYGLRLGMDEKYKGLKKQLSELSSIPPNQILLVEIFGALVKSFPQDSAKIKTLLGGMLYAYELPPVIIKPMSIEEERGFTVIKQSEQNKLTQGGLSQIQRMHTKHNPISADNLTPTNGPNNCNQLLGEHNPSDSELLTNNNLSPARPKPENKLVDGVANENVSANGSPGHKRTASNVSVSSNSTTTASPSSSAGEECLSGFIVAVHRKMIRMDVYFLSSQKTRPSLFGTPLILPTEETSTNQDLYQYVWTQVSRLVSPLPPSEVSAAPNHAQDCDDSLGYEYPFALKVVQKDGFTCAWCPWYRFCRGCKLECSSELFNFGSCYIAVDWEPTALHLRYQTSQERIFDEHLSVEESRRLQTEPIDLDACLKSFTKEEELGEDELYYCSKCKKHRLAAKKLEIWRLPPVLIIHLKRFQFHNGRWVKSQKIVKFPVEDFDPTNYLAPRDLKLMAQLNTNGTSSADGRPVDGIAVAENKKHKPMNGTAKPVPNGPLTHDSKSTPEHSAIGSPGPAKHPRNHVKPKAVDIPVAKAVEENDLLSEEEEFDTSIASVESIEDYTDVRYQLYAMSCHTGILGGGHYVSYAKNPNSKWYCYNDSSCKEVPASQLDTDSAYILFYERQHLDLNRFMPEITGKEPDTADIDDEFESDFKKMCVLQ